MGLQKEKKKEKRLHWYFMADWGQLSREV